MGNGWTPERRALQAALIRNWRPWDQSTGPRTAQGKVQAARNAQHFHGWTTELLALRAEIRAANLHARDLLREQGRVQAELARLLRGIV